MNNKLVKRLIAAVMISAAMFAQASTEVVDGIKWTYTISGGEASVGGGDEDSPAVPTSTKGDITIPSTLGGRVVTSVSDWAFGGCTCITNVTIPSSVTNIGGSAFYICYGLKHVSMPYCVANIGYKAFFGCDQLESVMIPSCTKSIGGCAFEGCTSLGSVVFSEGVKEVSDAAFSGCESLTNVTFSSTVEKIGADAFYDCFALYRITISHGVKSIGSNAFGYCVSLSEVDFAGKPPEMLSGAAINKDAAIRYNVAYEDEWLPVIEECGFTNVSPYAPSKADGGPYTEVVDGIEWTFVVSNGVASLGGGDREHPAVGLLVGGELTIPEVLGGRVVADVGVAAFAFHSNIVSVTFPQTITNIGGVAFYECVGLRRVELNEGLVSLENGAFAWCTNLESVLLPSTTRRLGSNLGDYGFEKGVTSEGHYYDISTNDLGCVREISSDWSFGNYECHGYGVFEQCMALSRVSLNDGLLEIGSGAFFGCSSLTDMEIPDSVRRICGRCVVSYSSFDNQSGFDSKELEKGMISTLSYYHSVASVTNTIITHGFLEDCSSLQSVRLPETLVYLGPNAFKDCASLKSVKMPSSLKVVNEGTFSGCKRLESIKLPEDLELLGGVELSPKETYGVDKMLLDNGCYSTLVSDHSIKYDGDWVVDRMRLDDGRYSVLSNQLSDTRWLVGDYEMRIPIDESGWVESSPMYWCVEQLGVQLSDCRRAWLDGPRRTEFHPEKPYYSSESNGVFYGCSKLATLKIPESVRRIADYAFYDCNNLTSISLPSGLKLLGYEVFGGESSLLSIETPWLNFGELWEVFPSHSYVTNLVFKAGPKNMEFEEFRRKIEKWIEEEVCLTDQEREQTYEYYAEEGWWSVGPILAGFGNLRSLTLPEGLASFDVSLGLECCPKLKAFNLPRSLKRVGYSAFAFSSLDKVEMPEAIDEIGDFVFSNCHVTDVVFAGCAPSCVSPNAFAGEGGWDPSMDTPLDLVVSVYPGTLGWNGDRLSPELPEDGLWPCNAAIYKRRAIEFVRQQLSKAAGGDGLANDFRYYDAEEAKMVSVPQSWLSAHGLIKDDGTGCANVNLSPLGSRTMWQDYVAGTDPTDENSKFTASVTIVGGKPVVSYSPELSEAEAAKRVYTTWGKAKLQDADWTVVPAGSEADYNFFKVTVEMK